MSLTPAVAESLRQALATVVVVPVTPLLADGNPDWTAYTTLTRRLIDGGIMVITPNGNAYHAAIANKVPDLGVVLYIRNERITGANIAALADRAPNVIGVKYGIRDASAFAAVARDAGIDRFTWLAGAAELTAPAYWVSGARGFTSGLANVDPGLPLAMLDALRGNDFGEAMKIWEKARRFEELRLADASADNVSVVKEALAQLGLCRADVRPPSRLLPDPVKQEISAMLTSWGLA
jgi:4-hydroxy-tetrahydrodipicolinate synthase